MLSFQCVLSAIIVTALRGAFRLLGNLPKLWRASRGDFVSILHLPWLSEEKSESPTLPT